MPGPSVVRVPSPNFGPRRDGARPALVVLHYTAMKDCASALERLCDPVAEVSCHYLLDEGGAIHALVPEEARAWHAGAGTWGGRGDVNSRSIGIELANRGNHPFAHAQITALEGLLAKVMLRWSIPPQGVIGHSCMAPDRKSDPGPRFDWRRLALRGLAVWPRPGQKGGDLWSDLRRFGYPDTDEATLLRAFRLRFRPWATGPADETDAALAADLAARFPVDAAPPGA